MAEQQLHRPTRAEVARIAENQPELLNLIVAYFVMEWQGVRFSVDRSYGWDQMGKRRLVPDYVAAWGLDAVVDAVNKSPLKRNHNDIGYMTMWLRKL